MKQWICILLILSILFVIAMPHFMAQANEGEQSAKEETGTGELPKMTGVSGETVSKDGSSQGTVVESGILTKDTIWSQEQSPYTLTGDIQIAKGVTLTIEPGVSVYGKDNGIKVCGSLKAIGVKDQKIRFEQVSVGNYGNTFENPALIQIEYADMNGGSLYNHSMGSGGDYGSLLLKDSYLRGFEYPIYIDSPQRNCLIERNIFDGVTFSCYADYARKITLQNNVFYNYKKAAIENMGVTDGSEIVVKYNSFLTTNQIALRLSGGVEEMDARENYFNTTDKKMIEKMIYDRADDFECRGYISYEPYLMAAHVDTPAPPAEVTPAPVVTPEPTAENQLGGIQQEDRTLTKEHSPYYLYENLQIAPGVTLSVEPGVEIRQRDKQCSILNYGTFMAVGTLKEPVLLEGIWIQSKGKYQEEPAVVEIEYTQMKDGGVDSSGYGYLSLKNSYLKSKERKHIVLNQIREDCYITGNKIEGGGIYTALNYQMTAFIQNNAFYDYTDYAIKNEACYNESKLVVSYNSFLTINQTALALEPNTSSKMEAVWNYFGTGNNNTIDQMIYDRNDDLACRNIITYEPFLAVPDKNTPIIEAPPATERPAVEYTESELGGIILEDRILTREHSPYIMLERVQVGEEATLTIEPGVVICGEQKDLQIFGSLKAEGSREENIVFNEVSLQCWGEQNGKGGALELSFVEMDGGELQPPGAKYGSIQLRDSHIHDLQYSINLWQANGDCVFERNIMDHASISASIDSGITTVIRNNVFYNYEEYAIQSWKLGKEAELLVQYNSFLDTGETTLMYTPGYDAVGMTALENYFNTADDDTIAGMIYDRNTNLSCSGLIPYEPYLTGHHQDTPYDETRMAKLHGDGAIDKATLYRFSGGPDGGMVSKVKWSVDREEIAEISQDGFLHPKTEGAVTITAEADGIIKKKIVMVRLKFPYLSFADISYNIETGQVSGICQNLLEETQSVCLVAAAYDAQGQVTGIWVSPRITIFEGSDGNAFQSSDLNAPEDGTVKVFAFNTNMLNGMMPLSVEAQIQVSEA